MIGLAQKPPLTCLELIRSTREKIGKLDAEIILEHLLCTGRAGLYIYENAISAEIVNKFYAFVDERASGKPLEYIFGKAEFMGLEFTVTPDVLIPRPETEILVEAALGSIKNMARRLPKYGLRILDLGTGSGNIAISLTKRISNCKIIGSDISLRALSIARENARLNGVEDKITFIHSDLFQDLPRRRFDIIVSNPPYIASAEIEGLTREVRLEPIAAQDGGLDGLGFYRRIIQRAPHFLKSGGFLLLEIGFNQALRVKRLLKKHGFSNIILLEDYNNIERITVAQWKN